MTQKFLPLQNALLDWFAQSARPLPWRDFPVGQRDPYRSWIAEILLQQTQMSRGLKYYHNFLQCFPDVHVLAQAPLDDVLKAWEGCGYYARARNLHKAAQQISLSGFPTNYDEWHALSGIGPYTAAALSSLVLGQHYAVSDGNVRRVFARLFGEAQPSPTWVQHKADALLPLPLVSPAFLAQTTQNQTVEDVNTWAGTWNEALMDLGATICTPKQPSCDRCPVCPYCQAHQQQKTAEYPAPKTRPKKQKLELVMLLIHHNGRIYLEKRRGKLLGGLQGLPTAQVHQGDVQSALDEMHRHIKQNVTNAILGPDSDVCTKDVGTKGVGTKTETIKLLGTIEHTMTHRQINAWIYALDATNYLCTERTEPLSNALHPSNTFQNVEQAALSRLDQKALALLAQPQLLS